MTEIAHEVNSLPAGCIIDAVRGGMNSGDALRTDGAILHAALTHIGEEPTRLTQGLVREFRGINLGVRGAETLVESCGVAIAEGRCALYGLDAAKRQLFEKI